MPNTLTLTTTNNGKTKQAASVKNSPLHLNVMQTVKIEFDEQFLIALDRAAETSQTNRVDFIKTVVEKAVSQTVKNDDEKVQRFVESYRRVPQQPEEYEIWQDEQVWDD